MIESYNKDKVKKFHEYTLNDYDSSDKINEIVNVRLVEKTDGSFIQIGIRPLIEEDIFIDPSFSEYLPGAGKVIAVGERDFLIKALIEDKNIEKFRFNENIKEFPKHIEFDDAVILLSTKFYVEFFTELLNRIDYEEGYPRLNHRYKIFSVSEKILGNKIMIIDKNAILWEKQVFTDKATGQKVSIDINPKPAKQFGKVDITIRSVNKIRNIHPDRIKIFEVKEQNGEKKKS